MNLIFSIEHARENERITIQIDYSGSEYNPFKSNDDDDDFDNLGIMLVKNIAETITYNLANNSNSIHITF